MNEISVLMPEKFVTDEVKEFRKRLIYLINNGEKRFTIDFSKCNLIDRSGVQVLISIHKKCAKLHVSFKILEVNNPNVIKIFSNFNTPCLIRTQSEI